MRQHTVSLWDSEALENMELLHCSTEMDIPFQVFDYIHDIAEKGTCIINKVMENTLDKEIEEKLWYSTRSYSLLVRPSNILVRGKSGKLYPMKVRPTNSKIYERVPLSEYIEITEEYNMEHDYKELAGKFIIIDYRQFNTRGREILSNL